VREVIQEVTPEVGSSRIVGNSEGDSIVVDFEIDADGVITDDERDSLSSSDLEDRAISILVDAQETLR